MKRRVEAFQIFKKYINPKKIIILKFENVEIKLKIKYYIFKMFSSFD